LASRLGIVDPIFPDQWHLVNEGFPEHMMNVTPVWEELGITGKGVYVAMVDDGVDYDHDDIKDNFVSI
jgi:kexin